MNDEPTVIEIEEEDDEHEPEEIAVEKHIQEVGPIPAEADFVKVPLTLEDVSAKQIALEVVFGNLAGSCAKAFQAVGQEIDKMKSVIIQMAGKGTKNQKGLLVPPQYRQPYRTVPESGVLPAEVANVPAS